ncbi:MAG TPA: BON domain-containing protein [Burkholderiaceae bacterium]|nr:BON domain-containing protein [Burkholderiaceae bacterium]
MNSTNKTAMRDTGALLLAAAAGALLMYVFDSRQGRQHMASARGQLHRTGQAAADLVCTGWRDLKHRARGLFAEAAGALRRHAVDDQVLAERVRAQLGRLVSHPHALRVQTDSGKVTLSGPVLKGEQRRLVRGVRRVRGVQEVRDELTPYRSATHVPALQGGQRRTGPRMELRQQQWAPGPRLLVVGTGTALVTTALVRRTGPAALLGAAGLILTARAVGNRELSTLLHLKRGEHRDAAGAGTGNSHDEALLPRPTGNSDATHAP